MAENSLYLNAIKGNHIDRTPIWIMRQAGRYLPEYHEIRSKYDFKTMFKTPELAAKITLQPIERFRFDAAIMFSDLMVLPEAMGQELEYIENQGPVLSPEIQDEDSLNELTTNEIISKLDYVSQIINILKNDLPPDIPLIGFLGAPFTLAAYMVEGRHTRNFKNFKSLIYENPEFVHKLLRKLTNALTTFAEMQIEEGADTVQIFDTSGGILPPHLYKSFSLDYINKILTNLENYDAPKTVYLKGGIGYFRELVNTNADVLSVDWMTDIAEARQLVNGKAALQGNLDPTALYGNKDRIKNEVRKILETFGNESGHIFNLGHGILPDTPLENVYYLVEQVREMSANLRS